MDPVELNRIFQMFDRNGDGTITKKELNDSLQSLGINIESVLGSLGLKQGKTLEDCKRMIMKVDVDGDGMVDFKEFRQMMKGGGFSLT
ncbi:hypothetical protein MTR67_029471 [Solanum verrucosum]|uniref:EF-hand domain-containing protein n=1 Tax=Solanum verrucosum TaxID=315347 RepID=A0AAF0RCQ9_SOLVR|nr:hypothetical protein MTR67_029471 [Solanum verrucosum]